MPLQSLYGYQIRKGELYNLKAINKFGYRDAVGTDKSTIGEVGDNYDLLTSAQALTVSSSSTNDASDGTGARTLKLYGLDENYNEASETISLNGQNGVSTAVSYIRVYRATVESAGSSGTNVGDLHIGYGAITSGIPANKIMTLPAGEGQTLLAAWTVPADYTGYLYETVFNSGTEATNKYIIGRLEVKEIGKVWQTKVKGSFSTATFRMEMPLPTVIPEKSDIKMTAVSSSGTQDVSGAFTIIYERNS